MTENKEGETICKSVFKSGESTTTAQEFTKMWILLINTLEKGKQEQKQLVLSQKEMEH